MFTLLLGVYMIIIFVIVNIVQLIGDIVYVDSMYIQST